MAGDPRRPRGAVLARAGPRRRPPLSCRPHVECAPRAAPPHRSSEQLLCDPPVESAFCAITPTIGPWRDCRRRCERCSVEAAGVARGAHSTRQAPVWRGGASCAARWGPRSGSGGVLAAEPARSGPGRRLAGFGPTRRQHGPGCRAARSAQSRGRTGGLGGSRRAGGAQRHTDKTLRNPGTTRGAAPSGTAPHTKATPTGLEPATSAVTGQRANQLRYGALLWSCRAYPQRDSNPCCRRERAES